MFGLTPSKYINRARATELAEYRGAEGDGADDALPSGPEHSGAFCELCWLCGRRFVAMYLATVVWPTLMPSLSSSP
jgi:hypothetical protein